MPVRCQLSIVKSSKNLSQNLKRSGVLDSKMHYEIEIELDNEKVKVVAKEEVVKQLKMVIKYILMGLQDTKYPVSYKEMHEKTKEYFELFGIEGDVDAPKPNNFIGYSTVTLKLLNVQENSFGEDINIRKKYTVTEKADGVRKLLYIDGKGAMYMIDTQIRIQYTGMHTKTKDIFNSVLDGEFIKYDKKGKNIQLFAAFDIYVLNKIDKRGESFITTNEDGKKMGRLPLLEKVIKSLNMQPGPAVRKDAFMVECKRFYTDEMSDIFSGCSSILQRDNDGLFPYTIDGLIFTPADKPIPVFNKRFTWEASFKWKPPKYNTIDFLVRTVKKNGREEEKHSVSRGPYKTLHLYCGFSGGYMDPLNDMLNYNSKDFKSEYQKRKRKKDIDSYKPALFIPTKPYDETAYVCNLPLSYDSNAKLQMLTEENEVIQDNTIVEFAYHRDEEDNFQWKPLRIRYDKTQQLRDGHNNFGNNFETANNNWNTIHNPITDEMITSGLEIPEDVDDDVYYNRKSNSTSTRALRDFHNLVVKNTLIQTVSKQDDSLMDFAVGKGGDMPKWIYSDLGFVYGVDISRDNIENKKDGACARFMNYALRNNKIPDMIFAAGDSSKNIRSGDALADDKYRMINDAVFGKGSRDKLKMGYNLFKNYGKGEKGFQITSCQFALHYFFENKYTLENFLSNVIECTALNGYFIGTSYDGNILFDMLVNHKKGEEKTLRDENGKKMWEIVKQYDREEFLDDGSCLGYAVDVYQESINKTFREYLVNYTYFNDLMNMYGFVLVPKDEIRSMGLTESSGLFANLFQYKSEQHLSNPRFHSSKIGKAMEMDEKEKEVSFLNRYFIYKKIRAYNGDVNIISSVSSEPLEESIDQTADETDETDETDENQDKNEDNEDNEEQGEENENENEDIDENDDDGADDDA